MKAINLTSRKGTWYNTTTGHEVGKQPNDPENYLYFGSALEFRVYRTLCSMFGANRVACQVPVVIFPAQKSFGSLLWRVDFGIKKDAKSINLSPDAMKLLIEVKGEWVLQSGYKGEFLRTLMMCEQNAPIAFSKLLLMSDKPLRLNKWLATASYQDAIRYLSNYQ